MPLRALRIVGIASIAAALLATPALSARAYDGRPQSYYASDRTRDRDGYPRAGSGRDGYARGDSRERPRPAEYRERRAPRCDEGGVGTILGAIAGGLLGNSASGRHGGHAAGILPSADRGCD